MSRWQRFFLFYFLKEDFFNFLISYFAMNFILGRKSIPRLFKSRSHINQRISVSKWRLLISQSQMSEPIILSDEEDHQNPLSSPLQPLLSKKRRTEFDPNPNPTVLILDDDPTPQKPGPTSTTYFVPDTPNSGIAIVKCTRAAQHKLSGWWIA